MGTSLHVEGQPWGVLTLDALEVGTFGAEAQSELRELIMLVEAALRTTRLEAETRALRLTRGQSRADGAPADNHEILGQSEPIARLLHEIDVVSDSELPILLLGETGVGKELFAHRVPAVATPRQAAGARELRRPASRWPRASCSATPGGARSRARWPTGPAASRPPTAAPCSWTKSANCRCWCRPSCCARCRTARSSAWATIPGAWTCIVAATNRSLKDLVRDGDFRADLYHRLSVYPIAIPPLRARGNDVLLLAGRYLEQNRARLGLRSLRLALDAEEALRRYRWPGNVRELEHVISRAAIKAVSRGANRNHIVTLEASLLDLSGADLRPSRRRRTRRPPRRRTACCLLRDAVDACQRQHVRLALQARRQLGRGRPRVGGGPQQPAQAGAPAGLEGLRAARYHPCPMKER